MTLVDNDEAEGSAATRASRLPAALWIDAKTYSHCSGTLPSTQSSPNA